MQRFIRVVDALAALSLAAVAAFTLLAVIGRKLFGWSPPDYFDFARLALGIALFWGIAAACYTNRHILVDLVHELAKPAWQRRIDLTATALLALAMLALAYAATQDVAKTLRANVRTTELRWPVWPFHALAVAGLWAAWMLTCVRLWRLLRRRPIED
ncbi:MAG: TRAP transporter small permease subunit [Sutterellaceae bacterium]|nr:TRAP transporter small permease [Burkholderiaceae bacterium]MDW8428899.1 TRAP transporter small permease subunit [Sutterellaceae bacterium]